MRDRPADVPMDVALGEVVGDEPPAVFSWRRALNPHGSRAGADAEQVHERSKSPARAFHTMGPEEKWHVVRSTSRHVVRSLVS